jgi:predicted hotdog family 3-hydroxylacyl-ACP dehydratase
MDKQKDIACYIPQRPPMVMITGIKTVDDQSIVTSFHIDKENIFCSEGLFREPGLIENIAQTAAAQIGYICEMEQKTIPLGFIGAIKKLVIHQVPATGDLLTTNVTIEHEVMNATIISGEIHCRGELLAECEMNIFLQEEEVSSDNPSG